MTDHLDDQTESAPASGLRDTGMEPPFTLAQTITWTALRAECARAAAEHWEEGNPKRAQHTREAERFEAIARELHRLRAIDAAR